MLLEYRRSHKIMTIILLLFWFFWCIHVAEDSITHQEVHIGLSSSFPTDHVCFFPKMWYVEIAPIIGTSTLYTVRRSYLYIHSTKYYTKSVHIWTPHRVLWTTKSFSLFYTGIIARQTVSCVNKTKLITRVPYLMLHITEWIRLLFRTIIPPITGLDHTKCD